METAGREHPLGYGPHLPAIAGRHTKAARALRSVLVVLTTAGALSMAAPLLLAQASLTPHDPIFIDGNAGLTPENGVTGGSGTPLDPYIIEGWEIAGAPGAGIELVGTDAHVVIRNVRVLASQTGVLLSSIVSNARIEDSEFLDNTLDGIRVYGREITIRRNTISSNRTTSFKTRPESSWTECQAGWCTTTTC
jgi:parallel beta-helix repeat protein